MRRYYYMFIFMLFAGAGCQVNYTDPYSGQVDPTRSLRSEGLISALYHTVSVRGWTSAVPPGALGPIEVCAVKGRSKRLLMSRLARDFKQYGHPAVRYSQNSHYFLVQLLGSDFAEADFSPQAYVILDAIGSRLKRHRKIYVQIVPPLISERSEVDKTNAQGMPLDTSDSLAFYQAQQIAGYLARYLRGSPVHVTSTGLGLEPSEVSTLKRDGYLLAICATR